MAKPEEKNLFSNLSETIMIAILSLTFVLSVTFIASAITQVQEVSQIIAQFSNYTNSAFVISDYVKIKLQTKPENIKARIGGSVLYTYDKEGNMYVLLGQQAENQKDKFTWCPPGGMDPEKNIREVIFQETKEETAGLYEFNLEQQEKILKDPRTFAYISDKRPGGKILLFIHVDQAKVKLPEELNKAVKFSTDEKYKEFQDFGWFMLPPALQANKKELHDQGNISEQGNISLKQLNDKDQELDLRPSFRQDLNNGHFVQLLDRARTLNQNNNKSL